jgi:hypothetical protein
MKKADGASGLPVVFLARPAVMPHNAGLNNSLSRQL